jgi:hypothetical protein
MRFFPEPFNMPANTYIVLDVVSKLKVMPPHPTTLPLQNACCKLKLNFSILHSQFVFICFLVKTVILRVSTYNTNSTHNVKKTL